MMKKRMNIVIVGFNIHERNSVVYASFKTKKGAVKAFERYLNTPQIQFLSIRKIEEEKKRRMKEIGKKETKES